MTASERADLAESMVPVACDLACRVRDGDAEGIARLAASLTGAQAAALLVVLAAMVPVEDASPGELLEWTGGLESALEWRQPPLMAAAPGRPAEQPCGTYAAWCRHKRRGEEVDRACYRAWQEYRAERRVVRKEIAAREKPDAAAA
jgi:hypothetical protein